MIEVFDFDGTLVKENSSRLLEKILLSRIQNKTIKKILYVFLFSKFSIITNFLLIVVGKLLFYEGDFRRFVMLNLFNKLLGKEIIVSSMEEVAKKLTLKIKEIPKEKIIILSSGLYPVIEKFANDYNLKVNRIYASRIYFRNNIVIIKEITLKDKKNILKSLISTYGKVIYYTDDIKEVTHLKTLKNLKVILLV